MRIPILLVATWLLTTPCRVAVYAQPSSKPPELPREIKGPELPAYFVVQGFFDQAISKRRAVESGAYLGLLQALDLEPGGEAQKRLDQALDEAEAILAKPTVDPSIDNEEEYWSFQMEALRVRARSLGTVYGRLVRDLGRLDKSIHLEHYLDYRIRPGTSIWLNEELPIDLLSVADEFDHGITSVEEGGSNE